MKSKNISAVRKQSYPAKTLVKSAVERKQCYSCEEVSPPIPPGSLRAVSADILSTFTAALLASRYFKRPAVKRSVKCYKHSDWTMGVLSRTMRLAASSVPVTQMVSGMTVRPFQAIP
ncbi:hypothetical protein RRG08_026785 [Elysia crispata]|uniref:Uncharacterized protein n=1 Tax=Elysia crispata TaxID=231223 RepID=A0AAE1E2T2_9GAST|nr:hypothetical protein RRG08_026785 [Elysia crispata]